ncbi:MAG: SH3 domain-containing protein, partial [Clostridiales bacterium]|nr:SH3 domain-containing protein [Clostridiales bacterium]
MKLKRAFACLLALTLTFGVIVPAPDFGAEGMGAWAETADSVQETTVVPEGEASAPAEEPPLTAAPAPTATPAPTAAPSPTATAAPTAAPSPTDAPSPTAAPAPTATAAPTDAPSPTATAAPTDAPAPTATAAPTAAPAPTDAPAPTATAAPSATPEPDAPAQSPLPEGEEAGFESGYARLAADGSVHAAPSDASDALGVLARDSIVYVSERISQHWLKVVFAYEQDGMQMAQGYLREECLVPEADQAAAAAAILSGPYVTCEEYGGIALAPASWLPAEESREDGGQAPAADEPVIHQEINREGIVDRNKVNLRTGPSKKYDIAAVRDQGDPVFVLHSLTGEDGALWYCIRHNAEVLYVMAEFVSLAPQEEATPAPSAAPESTVTLTHSGTNVSIDGVPPYVTASVAIVEADEGVLEAALNQSGLTLRDAVCYDITLWQDESEYQPAGSLAVTLPIPAEFTDEISVWHISGGTATNMGGSAAGGVFTFEADHFSQYALVSAAAQDGTPGTKSSTFLEKAESYYGENGTITVGTVRTQWLDAGDTVKAGQQVNLSLAWTLVPAATFNYTDIEHPLFDDYENTQIVLTLPDGVSIVESSAGSLQNVTEVIHQNGEWILKLTDRLNAASSQSGTITIPLLIEGNGKRGMGEVLDFSSPVRLETEFVILDRTVPGQAVRTEKYNKTIYGSGLSAKTTVTDDRWGIEKAAISAVPSKDKSTVTVTFRLTVGLEDA